MIYEPSNFHFIKIEVLWFVTHLFNKRGGWNKHRGGAKVAKPLNVEVVINIKGRIFGNKLGLHTTKNSEIFMNTSVID